MKTVLLALLVAAAVGALPAGAKAPGEVEVGQVLRQAPMQGILGPSRLLSDFRGKPLIINVWASWCGPCQAEMPSLQRLAKRAGQQVQVIGISTDDYHERAESFVRTFDIGFPNFIDSKLRLEHMLGAERLPLTLLVDAQGKVVAKHFGAKEWGSPQALAYVAKHLRIKL